MKLYAHFQNGRLIPDYNNDHDKIGKLKPGVSYLVEIKQPRNIKFHRKYFALINLAFENQEHFDNPDDMRDYVTMRAGYYVRVNTPTGEYFKPKSIAFSSMDETEFEEVYNRSMDVICEMLDTTKDEIIENIVNFM